MDRLMKKQILLSYVCALIFSAGAFAEKYESKHFIIHSDSNPRYITFVQTNVEKYYENLKGQYFSAGWKEPVTKPARTIRRKPLPEPEPDPLQILRQQHLTIYYSESESDTQRLLSEHGESREAADAYYIASVPAVYAHRMNNNGDLLGRGPLFREIINHFIHINSQKGPEWFKQELALFLGEQAKIVKGNLTFGEPNPSRKQHLRDKLEKEGIGDNVKRLFLASPEKFNSWEVGRAFTQVFFCWLHEKGQLKNYLQKVYSGGHKLPVLEETVNLRYGEIKNELEAFIKTNCSAVMFLEDGRRAEDQAQKKEAFLKALQIKPDYQPAQVELAKYYYYDKDYGKCRENLTEVLDDPQSIESRRAARMMGNMYYKEKDYLKAVEYYNKAWEYSDYYEYKYRVAYQIGNCYYYLKDDENAKKWYKSFLDSKWEANEMEKCADYARDFLACNDKAAVIK
jgi:tetratricopeptide (TPR) repeat protein